MNPSFKYSGVHWIGKVPSNWNILALKRYAPYISRGRSPDYTDDKYKGIPIINQACIYWDGLKLEKVKFQDPSVVTGYRGKLYQGDLLINSTGTGTLGRVGVFNLDGEYLADSHVTIIRPAKEIFAKYLYYLLQTDVYQGYIYSVLATGATNQIELSREGLSDTPIIVPPISQQKSIASFLDLKTATIDTLIAKKQRLIQLLEEKRTALIDRAVTKGLNPNAPMKESGISWIGEIPQHWKILKLGIFAEVTKLTGFEYTNHWVVHPNNEIIALRGFNIKNGKLILNDVEKISSQLSSKLFRSKLFSGDIVFPCTGTIGNGALIEEDNKFHINQNIAKITTRKNWSIHAKYILNQLCSHAMKYQIDRLNSSGIQPVLLIGTIRNLICVLPDIEEQRIVSNYIDLQNERFDKTSDNLFSQIEKLQEYRRSLITAAVTGKLDISEVTSDHAC